MSKKKTEQDRIAAIAKATGGKVGERIEGIVHGPIGASRLAAILSARLRPSQGKGTGRPTDPSWSVFRRIPMKQSTFEQLERLAESLSHEGRRISPMQVAAELLERGLELVNQDKERIGT